MKKRVKCLGVLLGASLMGTACPAATVAGATLGADGRVTYAAPGPQHPFASPQGLLKEIYSTFSDDPATLYDCCGSYVVTTTRSSLHFRQSIAVPFTTTRSGVLRKIQLALSYFDGINALSITLRADAGGLPGKTLHRFQATDIPPGGNCCDVTVASPQVFFVKGGTTYWVAVKANADTYGGWNFNSIGAFGSFAIDVSNGWGLTTDALPALRVLGV